MYCLNPTSPHFARKGSLHAAITEQHLGHAETYFAQALQQVALASVLALQEQWVGNILPKYCKTQALLWMIQDIYLLKARTTTGSLFSTLKLISEHK